MIALIIVIAGAALVVWGYRVMDRSPSYQKGDGVLVAAIGYVVAAIGLILALLT